MELLLIAGYIVKGVVWAGYGITGSYLIGTGVRYYRDYKEYNERG
ncbi:MAG: hypothetical protein ABS939_23350 [Psychrobacillus sp.]